MVMSGYKEEEWWAWLDGVPGRLVTKDGRMIPIIPVAGNHDIGYFHELGIYSDMSDYNYYRGIFALPGNELWYTLDFPNIRLIALLTAAGGGFAEHGSSADKRYDKEILQQVDFLREQLKNSDKKWKITTQHIHITGTFPFIWNTRAHVDHWVPLFEKYKVNLNLAGHLHNYTRTWPIKHLELSKDFVDFVGKRWGFDQDLDPRDPKALWPKGPPIVELAHNSEDGVTYLLNGVWGAPFEWPEKGTWSRLYPWFAKAHSRLSITVVEETDKGLHVVTKPAKRLAWYGIPINEPLDEFWLPYRTKDFPPAEYNIAF
jgi:hypothetical protein